MVLCYDYRKIIWHYAYVMICCHPSRNDAFDVKFLGMLWSQNAAKGLYLPPQNYSDKTAFLKRSKEKKLTWLKDTLGCLLRCR